MSCAIDLYSNTPHGGVRSILLSTHVTRLKVCVKKSRFELFILTSVSKACACPCAARKDSPLRFNRKSGNRWAGVNNFTTSPFGVTEMIFVDIPNRTKPTEWTPVLFCWFWLSTSTPMALRDQQVKFQVFTNLHACKVVLFLLCLDEWIWVGKAWSKPGFVSPAACFKVRKDFMVDEGFAGWIQFF